MKQYYGMIFMLSSLMLYADETLKLEGTVNPPAEFSTQAQNEGDYLAWTTSKDKSKDNRAKKDNEKKAPPREFSQQVQVGGNYSYAWIKPKGNHTTKGSLGGVRAIYEYRPQDWVYAATAFSWRAGTTENGATKRKLQDFNGQERVGYTFGKERIGHNRLTLFTGAGVRYLAEKVSVNSASLDLDYTEFYIPVGFLFENTVNSIFSWGCNFQWMPQVFPIVRLKPLSGAQWGLTYKISNFFVEVPLTFSGFCDRLAVIVSPFFETWHDGRSTAKTTTGLALGLPSNSYIFTGVNVSLAVSF